MSQNQRRQSIIPLPVPSSNASSSDDDIEIIESDNDEVKRIVISILNVLISCSTK